MATGFSIRVVDPDDDYLCVELRASADRFAGATRIYAGLDELNEFASRIRGFPDSPLDERKYEFGSREPGIAGGFCCVRFMCRDGAGHAAVEISIEDDDQLYEVASATFSFRVESAEVDRFTERLRDVERARAGEAVLAAAV